jgi:hypothetical protein
VPHPGGGFNAWWSHVWSAFGRNWRQLLPIVLLTATLPGLIYTIVSVQINRNMFTFIDNGDTSRMIVHWHNVAAVLAAGGVFAIVSAFTGAIGWSAGMWIVARRAVGAPAPLGTALAFGARNCARIGGILLVVGLMVSVGIVACLVPGLYLAVAASLVVPFAIFDRGTNAIGASFRLVNRNFGAVLGRLAIMYLLLAAVSVVVSIINTAASGRSVASSDTVASGSGGSSAAIVGDVLLIVILVPSSMFLLIGILMTYAQMRARMVPTTAHDLVAGLGA